jgi:hypothetical protein
MSRIYVTEYLSLGIKLAVKHSSVTVVAEAATYVAIQGRNKSGRRGAGIGAVNK